MVGVERRRGGSRVEEETKKLPAAATALTMARDA